MMFYRLFRLVVKELQALLGNTQGRKLLIVPVLLQTALFPFAATLEVKNATIAIYNQDSGVASRELMQRLAHTGAFAELVMVHSDQQLQQVIDNQQTLLAVRFAPDFTERLLSHRGASLNLLLDGRRSNSAQIASGYVMQVVNAYATEQGGNPGSDLMIRNLYNPNLDYKWHVLPSLIAIITTVGCLIVTALSVAREREEGTFDQLLVSPLTPAYIMAGKLVPGILVALFQGSIIAFAARFIYGVPFTGSLPVLFLGLICYGMALAGVGLFISSISATQQQAFLGVFAFMVPAVILSGYVAPIENMPLFLQWLAHVNPLTYLILIVKGCFLKGMGLSGALPHLWPMLVIAVCTLTLALRLFRSHIA